MVGYDYTRTPAKKKRTESLTFIPSTPPHKSRKPADYKKTELRKSVELMEKTLLEPMALALKRRLRAERESEFRVSRVVSCSGSCVGMDRGCVYG